MATKFDREQTLHRKGWQFELKSGLYCAPDGARFESLDDAEAHQAQFEHAVFATLEDFTKVRVSDFATWDRAQNVWRQMDDRRRDRSKPGQYPDVRHFEVRSAADPNYAHLPFSLTHVDPLLPSRGFAKVADAARRAWKLWQGETTPYGTSQGTGGWFYCHNGRPAAQGLGGDRADNRGTLVGLCLNRGLVRKGVDGRWYPAVSEL